MRQILVKLPIDAKSKKNKSWLYYVALCEKEMKRIILCSLTYSAYKPIPITFDIKKIADLGQIVVKCLFSEKNKKKIFQLCDVREIFRNFYLQQNHIHNLKTI